MNIVITGGCGFLGSYVARDLVAAGHRVVVADTRSPDLLDQIATRDLSGRGSVDVHDLDVTDLGALTRLCREASIEGVVHLAGLLTGDCASSPTRGAMVNIIGTTAVFDMAELLRIERLIWGGSISVFGHTTRPSVVTDDTPHHPDSFYSLYKSVQEHLAQMYYAKFGVPSVGIRIPMGYGYGRTRGRGSWVYELLANPALGRPGRVHGGDALVPWIYVEDISAVIVRALEVMGDGCGIYNLGGDVHWKSEAVAFVKELLPDADIRLVGSPDLYPTEFDDHRIRDDLGWAPQHDMRSGMEKTINAYRQAAGLPAVWRDDRIH